MKYYLLVFNEDWGDEHNVPALACMNETEFKNWSNKRLSISAHLGNNGDCFMEDDQGKTGKELIQLRIVEKTVVDENFYKIFNKAGLEGLSLSDIFEEDNIFEEEEDDE